MTRTVILNNLQRFYEATISLSDYDLNSIYALLNKVLSLIKKADDIKLYRSYSKAKNRTRVSNTVVCIDGKEQPLNSEVLHNLINLTAYYFRNNDYND